MNSRMTALSPQPISADPPRPAPGGGSLALALYRGLGFTDVGLRKAYYRGGDALVLRLSLPADLA